MRSSLVRARLSAWRRLTGGTDKANAKGTPTALASAKPRVETRASPRQKGTMAGSRSVLAGTRSANRMARRLEGKPVSARLLAKRSRSLVFEARRKC
ncbi:hypothetical protein ERJ75_000567100 [Trypanosoma vivax]|nr:hypothetical protein ERJ75_000567100 [Trypanosoma vivax]